MLWFPALSFLSDFGDGRYFLAVAVHCAGQGADDDSDVGQAVQLGLQHRVGAQSLCDTEMRFSMPMLSRTWPPKRSATSSGHAIVAARSGGQMPLSTGNQIVKVLPVPNLLSISSKPPIRPMISLTMLTPSPVPGMLPEASAR